MLLAAGSLYAADVRTVSVDIRIVGTEHVDLSSIHKWIDEGRKGDRPMTHWKFVTIETLQQTAPWLTGYVQIDRQEHKTVYLKNIPREITKNLNDVRAFEAQAKTLTDEIASDTKRLVEEDAVEAKPKSQFARRREQ